MKIFPIRCCRTLGHQRVIGDAERARWKQLLTIAVLGKGSGLAHQPIDHVPVVHALLVPAAQTWLPLDQLLGVPHLDLLGIQADLDFLADQPAGHRVTVPLDVNQAALVHATTSPLACFQPSCRQRTQHRQLFGQPLPAPGVQLLRQPAQETLILLAARKITAATQHQGLIHGLLETPMPLLDVAVLMSVVGLDLLADHSVVTQQALITLRELLPLRQVVHCRAQTIRPMTLRYAAQVVQRVLQSFTQALEALREAERHRLPVRVGQHEVVDHVLEALAGYGHAQLGHVREVRRGQPAGFMHLAEEYFLGRSRRGPPAPHLPLQGPQLSVAEPSRVAPLQLAEDCLGLQAGLLLEQRAHFRPDLGKRIEPRGPVMRPGQFAGQLLLPSILACRLVVHVRPRRRHGQCLARRQQPTQSPYLLVRNHRKPPSMRDLRLV